MENRDRDKSSKNTGEKVSRSDNIEREPSRKSGIGDSSGMHSDSDRSSSSDYEKGEGGVRYRGGNRGGTTSEEL